MAETQINEQGFQDGVEQVETESVKCSSCGSNMVFNADTQTLYCEHCGTTQAFDLNTVAKEQDLRLALYQTDNQWSKDETSVFHCDNCGAKVVLSASETAKECPFCGTPHVQKVEELAGIKPNAVLPFKFGIDKAILYAKDWAKKRFFAPRDFKKNLSTEKLHGVYSPCFTFDSQTVSTYHGRIGKTHTRTVGSGKNRRVERYVVWRDISGTFCHAYDDVYITAGTRLDQKQLDKIAPYDTNSSKVYEENYLLGYMAYHYDKDIEDCWGEAKNIMDASIRRGILSQYSHDRVAYLNVSTTHQNVTYKYVMLPVYVGNYKYHKKVYNFHVNGDTGKVHGKTPKSFWKILLTVLGIAAVIVGIGYLIYSGM